MCVCVCVCFFLSLFDIYVYIYVCVCVFYVFGSCFIMLAVMGFFSLYIPVFAGKIPEIAG